MCAHLCVNFSIDSSIISIHSSLSILGLIFGNVTGVVLSASRVFLSSLPSSPWR